MKIYWTAPELLHKMTFKKTIFCSKMHMVLMFFPVTYVCLDFLSDCAIALKCAYLWLPQKASSCACQLSPEVTAYHSGSLSHHWGHRTVLLALLPAWAGARVIINQDITASAALPLSSAHLVRASHQRGQQDIVQLPALHQPAPTRVTGRRNPSQLEKRNPGLGSTPVVLQ